MPIHALLLPSAPVFATAAAPKGARSSDRRVGLSRGSRHDAGSFNRVSIGSRPSVASVVGLRRSVNPGSTHPGRGPCRGASLTVSASAKGTKVIVQGRADLEITDSIRDYADKKIEKAVAHFDMADIREVDVRCSARGGEKQLGGQIQKTEVTVYTKHGTIRCEEEGEDLYASIDAVSDKIDRKLRKLKEKKQSKHKGGKSAKDVTDAIMDAAAMADDALAEEEDVFVEVVREKFHAVKVCTVLEAAEEMESMGHSFYAFRNKAQNKEVNVVYKRDAGGYGVIIPVDIAGDISN